MAQTESKASAAGLGTEMCSINSNMHANIAGSSILPFQSQHRIVVKVLDYTLEGPSSNPYCTTKLWASHLTVLNRVAEKVKWRRGDPCVPHRELLGGRVGHKCIK